MFPFRRVRRSNCWQRSCCETATLLPLRFRRLVRNAKQRSRKYSPVSRFPPNQVRECGRISPLLVPFRHILHSAPWELNRQKSTVRICPSSALCCCKRDPADGASDKHYCISDLSQMALLEMRNETILYKCVRV